MENRTFACENAEQLIKLILSRRSYRGTFSPDPVPREDLEKIMEQNRQELNAGLPVYSKLQAFELQEEEFMKTPKRSIKRYLYK